jgi:hypothetical protein
MTPASPSTSIEERVTAAIAVRHRRIHVLSYIAWALGGLSFLASATIVVIYFTSYLPKQKQVLQNIGLAVKASRTTVPPAAAGDANAAPQPSETPSEEAARWRQEFPAIQSLMTHVLGVGTMLIALAVGLVSLGMLVILTVVFLTRRATLSQIQTSLAQISAQLQSLRPGNSVG